MAVRDARLKEAGMLEDAYKQMELDKLDRDEARLAKIINGVDDEKAMAAIRTRVRVAQRRAALIGVDAPTRQTLTVISEDVIDAELRRLEEELGSRGVVKSDTA